MEQFYKTHVFCCVNRREPGHSRGCCAEKGSEDLREYMKEACKRFGKAVRINSSGCLDRCELGPVMVIYQEGVWYRYDTREDIDEIIKTHLEGGMKVERLLLDNNRRKA